MRRSPLWLVLMPLAFAGCTCSSTKQPAPGMTATQHDAWFHIGAGATHALETPTADGAITCESCHRTGVMKEVSCLGCHKHPLELVDGHDVQEALHLGAPDFRARVPAGADIATQSQGCVFCHASGKRLLSEFPHAGIPTGVGTWCAACHDVDHAFAALPVPGFTHADVGGTDCGACHSTSTWKSAAGAPTNTFSPSSDVSVDALTPAWSATSIVSVTPAPQTLHMVMNHASRALDAGVLSDCAVCHPSVGQGSYAPGTLHASLAAVGAAQPSTCADCHAATPLGFVGPLDARRSPSSGPMRHDAVLWSNGAPTATKAVSADCSVCHRAPDASGGTFTSGQRNTLGVRLHASLTAAGAPQPASCLDCHANSRPAGVVTSGAQSFDHATALGDCAGCHASTSSWAGGRFHAAGSPAPTTCLPCHDAERPTSATGWSGSDATSPFDFGTNAAGVTHGDGLDCVACHGGPGTGAWGSTANWQGGRFDHAPSSPASTTCITCHSTQRPDRLTPPANPGFDHATNGAADCFGCHQATVARGSYAVLLPIPGGDWKGGVAYPGATPIASATQFVSLASTALTRSGATVTGMTTTTVTLPNAFLHTSAAIPSAIAPGPAGSTNQSSCWHCHVSTGATVTALAGGTFHASLTNFRATPTSPVTPLPQPALCLDCHATMRPPNIVSRVDGGTWVQPMDHSAALTGTSDAGVRAMDCGSCHHTPGAGPTRWSDGAFHVNVPSGQSPAECVGCHYPLSTTNAADVASGSPTAMKHRSPLAPTQACATCHTGALAKSTTSPLATTLWRPGAFHASGPRQPASCLDCHSGSAPRTSTQSMVTYALALGGSASNGGQWMSHADPLTASKDCVTCHAADAKTSGSAWSRASTYHAHATTPGACSTCHGLANGLGQTPGTNNNLPAGLVDSSTVTTSSVAPAGTHDQLSHAEVNVAGVECNRCHTQVGPSTQAGVQGKEWAQAAFHKNVSALNVTTGRCSTCHLNVKPAAGQTAFDHSALSATSTQDCSSCHTFPGTSAATPNWKGAVGGAPSNTFDSTADVTVSALTPRWSGTFIVNVAPNPQTLHMMMNHQSRALDAGVLADCALCHAQASLGAYKPGVLHWSLTTIGAPQPSTCADCHADTPEGFVGLLDSQRTPSTGPMRHDAVLWSNGTPTTTRTVTAADCGVCHRAPDAQAATSFADGPDGGAHFHASLSARTLAQPGSCLDCHANSRPGVVTSGPVTFDHATALGDCKSCHASTSTWTGGKLHATSSAAPATCLPCHAGERPTSTAGWTGSYANSPFDYGTNAAGVTHGDGLDCVACHGGPGTGAWGVNANWQGGRFTHSPSSVAATTCITCHSSQRPDLLSPPANPGFDHAANGASDCVGCHQASVARGSFVSLLPIPGGDWRGGVAYPGASPVTSPTAFVRIPSTTLTRSGATVTGMTTATVTLPNAFLHTSPAIPAAISPGPASAPNQASCWHCHTATGTTVTSYAGGTFHASLTAFRATPTAAVSPLAQPTTCVDCHASMRPPNLVSKLDGGTWIQPMDHAATFSGGAVAGVSALDCSACHHTPGLGATQWSDGAFHANTPSGAAPGDCVSCHYPISTTASADVAAGSSTAMRHRSAQAQTQACAACHATALSKSTTAPSSASQWRPGRFHASLTTQPSTCLDCHSASDPTTATQSTVTYVLPQGGTTSNGGQWMSHADPATAAKDCVTCHAGDAKTAGSAWSRSTAYHAHAPTPGSCTKCHGTGNGKGTTPGTGNNLPAGLTDSSTLTTSSAAAAGTHDQLTHADVNVSTLDCSRCHTQAGPSTVSGVQGKEWAQALFHKNVATLTLNGSTGRCSNCHLNVKPGSTYTAFDHSGLTGTSAQDCSACHSWPGTSTTTPNWKGASGMPHASSGSTTTSALDCGTCHGPSGTATPRLAGAITSHFGGVSNGNGCTTCHLNFSAFTGTVSVLRYGHTNSTANANGCGTCHAFASQLYTTLTTTPSLSHPTTAGAHTFSQAFSVTGTNSGESFTDKHSSTKMTNCGACHQYATTTATTNTWTFLHRPNNPGIFSSKSSVGCNECH